MTVRLRQTDLGLILRQKSVLFLIAVNLIPLMGVFSLGWDAGFLMLIYWIETVIIGVFNIPKLLTSRKDREGQPDWLIWLSNLFLTAFFCAHYGMFNFGHLMFLGSFFDLPTIGVDIFLVAGGLSLSHIFSLIVNWFGEREFENVTSAEQMFKPYGRIVVMHVAILVGAFFMIGGDQSAVAPLVLLVFLKTVSDILAHAASHGWIRLEAPA